MKTVLFFGLIRPYKGVRNLIEACRDIPDIKLLIVGEVWEDYTIIEELNKNNQVEFVNTYIDDCDIPSYFDRADVLVIPYLRASQSGVAHIGMGFGLPIVYTNVGGLREALINYSGGICCEKNGLKEGIQLALSKGKGHPIPSGMTFTELAKKWDVVNPTIIGPSLRFESGISHYTIELANSLKGNAVLFRNMLLVFLFPGKKRVGKSKSNHRFKVPFIELLDWYNPFTWIKAGGYLNDTVILEWWTSSVIHMYLFIMLLFKRHYIIEYHEVIDPGESTNPFLTIYSRVIGKIIRHMASSFVVHSEADRELIQQYYRIDKNKIKVIPHGIYNYHS